ncbi:ABC transporter ATP-binding protein [Gracilibacillus suaedae]|uniref:ABC transporter ATP-binding protein n=1 Tax=Gracilibacillus suaedae TaxID=2820273 RepID=UPI001ABEC2D1
MEVNDISFSYTGEQNQLQQISTNIQHGKITTIIGPNGSGKSTFLQLLSRNLTYNTGQILLNGKEINQYVAKEFAKMIAVVHQQNIAPDDMTVEKLIEYGRLPYRKAFQSRQKDDQDIIEWALSATKLTDKRNKHLAELSGGERQRVWIAMALAQDTPFLFLDEPTTYLDMYHQIEILELVKELNEKHQQTIIMVLHDLNQAITYSDYLMVMKQGKKIKEGKPIDIMTSEIIEEVYGVKAKVKKDEDHPLYIVPIGIGKEW